jgi:hypothetical protein
MFPARDRFEPFELRDHSLPAGLDDARPQPSATLADDGKDTEAGSS